MEIDIRPTEVLELYHMGVGSQQFVTRYVLAKLDEKQIDNPRLRRLIDEAFVALDEAARLNLMWLQRKDLPKLSRRKAVEIDYQIDATLGGIYNLIKVHAGAYGDSPAKRMAQELLDELLSGGVHPITTMRFEDQYVTTDEILRILRTDYPDHVTTIGLTTFVDDLEFLNDEFMAALRHDEVRKVEFADVKAARKKGEWAFTKVIFVIYGDYIEDEATRQMLLAGLVDQQLRIREAMKRRNTVPKVGPESGEFVEADEELAE